MTKQHIHIIKMGGTIEFFDPDYDIIKSLMKLDSTIDHYLENIIKPHFSWSTETITQKDSRELSDEDRTKLSEIIVQCPHENILVTHGTFTMVETAEFLENRAIRDKIVIFTGSMIPLAGFTSSDGGFNIGFAAASFLHLEDGVYIGMNGGIFTTKEIQKNRALFRFE